MLLTEGFKYLFVAPKGLDDAYDDNAGIEFMVKTTDKPVIADSRYTPANAKKYPHYFMPVGNATHIDLYDICDWLGASSVIGHAIKKLACAGKRGAKNEKQDLLEAIDCINRRIEVLDNLK